MKYQETCQCCGHMSTAYTLPLNRPLVNAFIKFIEMYFETGVGISKGEIGLTNAQYSNFQNLRHYGIIKQYDKGQAWYPTELGRAFYYGEVALNVPTAHMGGKTLTDDHPAWETHTRDREMKVIKEIEDTHYKQRPEYQEEKTSL